MMTYLKPHLPWDLKSEEGPFDIIGDVHGCYDELTCLLKALGYQLMTNNTGLALSDGPVYVHPEGRKAIFLGDLVDRGPAVLETLRIVHNMVQAGSGFSVIGNHDDKLLRKLKGRNVKIKHGLETSLAQLEALPETVRDTFKHELCHFLESLFYYLVLDHGKLIVTHAGIREEMVGRSSDGIKAFTLYGDTTGQTDEYGLPIRNNWAAGYHGESLIVYGHTPVLEPTLENNTVNIDTGCIFGGKLTALRYPEREFISIPARQIYYESPKPFLTGEVILQ